MLLRVTDQKRFVIHELCRETASEQVFQQFTQMLHTGVHRRQQNECSFRSLGLINISVYIGLQLASIPLVFGLLSFSLMDLDYSDFADSDGSLSSSQLWQKILSSSGYPGGIFNYSSKYFHYYLQTNIQFVTLLPAALFFLTFTISVNVYFKLLAKIRNYEFSLYRTKYSKMYGSYR